MQCSSFPDRIRDILISSDNEINLHPEGDSLPEIGEVVILQFPLREGFSVYSRLKTTHILTDKEIFGYSKKKDYESCKLLDSLLPKKMAIGKIRDLIENKPVFIIGAGPSLPSCISILKKYKKITKIVADGATRAIIENKLKADIVVTDLDGDIKSLQNAAKTNTIMIVHAHGDNIEQIHFIKNFRNCIGTTQTKSIGNIHNFGGFTDGDRCVFLANHFKAKKIILLGMDFGTRIGKYSKTVGVNRKLKIAKLRRGKKLLEWLAEKSESELYSTSKIKGFTKINLRNVDNIITKNHTTKKS